MARPEKISGKGLLRWGIALTAIGIAHSMGVYPMGFDSGQAYPLHLGPWMPGGFVPLFLGLALILIYYLTENNTFAN